MKIQMKNTLFKKQEVQEKTKRKKILDIGIRLASLGLMVVFVQGLSKLVDAPYTVFAAMIALATNTFPTEDGIIIYLLVLSTCLITGALSSCFLMPVVKEFPTIENKLETMNGVKFFYNLLVAGGYKNVQNYSKQIETGTLFYFTSKIVVNVLTFACLVFIILVSMFSVILTHLYWVAIYVVFFNVIIYISMILIREKYKGKLKNMFAYIPNQYKVLATMVFFNLVVQLLSLFTHNILHI